MSIPDVTIYAQETSRQRQTDTSNTAIVHAAASHSPPPRQQRGAQPTADRHAARARGTNRAKIENGHRGGVRRDSRGWDHRESPPRRGLRARRWMAGLASRRPPPMQKRPRPLCGVPQAVEVHAATPRSCTTAGAALDAAASPQRPGTDVWVVAPGQAAHARQVGTAQHRARQHTVHRVWAFPPTSRLTMPIPCLPPPTACRARWQGRRRLTRAFRPHLPSYHIKQKGQHSQSRS